MQTLQLGKLEFHSNLIQGPLAGYSCAPFRKLAWRYGKPGFCCTEMLPANTLINKKISQQKRYIYRDPDEGPLCYQLSGNNADSLAKATVLVSGLGADIIDLNCGCPVGKVRTKGSGSKLLATPEKLYQLVCAMRQNTDAVVSIKVRIGGKIQDHDDLAVIDAAEHSGVDFITVHGRHWTERYDVPCNNNDIAKIVKAANVPVIANGDVEDAKSLQKIINETNCAGIMIARASVGQPWLFEKLRVELRGETFKDPSIAEVGEILLDHVEGLLEFEAEKLTILQFRKLAKYYARQLPDKKAFIIAAQQACTQRELEKIVHQFF